MDFADFELVTCSKPAHHEGAGYPRRDGGVPDAAKAQSKSAAGIVDVVIDLGACESGGSGGREVCTESSRARVMQVYEKEPVVEGKFRVPDMEPTCSLIN